MLPFHTILSLIAYATSSELMTPRPPVEKDSASLETRQHREMNLGWRGCEVRRLAIIKGTGGLEGLWRFGQDGVAKAAREQRCWQRDVVADGLTIGDNG